jgi:hypothetical protein
VVMEWHEPSACRGKVISFFDIVLPRLFPCAHSSKNSYQKSLVEALSRVPAFWLGCEILDQDHQVSIECTSSFHNQDA